MTATIRTILLAGAMTVASTVAMADDTTPYANTLTGTWGGYRTWLLNQGIDLQAGYVSETASNVQGGVRQGTRYTDQWNVGATLDLDRLLGLNHASFQATITDRNGRNLSSDEKLGSLQQVQEVFGRGQTWRITQFWYDQSYFGEALDWKIGRLTVGEDFANFSCDFMNLAFCGSQPGNVVGSYWFNWPVSQWATRLKAAVPRFGYVQLGAYAVNPNWLQQKYAFYPGNPSGTTGALIPLEIGWLPTFGATHLQGSYKFGVWYNTSQTPDIFENVNGQALAIAGGQPRGRDGAYGAYVNFLQKLTTPSLDYPDVGASVFLNATIADHRTAAITNQVALGVKYTGPFASRPQDDVAIAFGRTGVNGRIANGEALQNAAGLGPVAVQGSEYESELYYTLRATNWLDLRPNVQYIRQPGGISQTDDIILGLKLSIRI
jgi:porin